MVIAIDMDDVLCELVDEWLNRYNVDYDDYLNPAHIKSWDIANYVKCGKIIYDYLADESLYELAKEIEWAGFYTKYWIKQGHKVIVVTRVHHACAAQAKIKWLNEYYPHLKDIIILTNDLKHHIHADVLIDDGLHNLEHFDGFKLLFTQPWNVNNNDDYYTRVHTWYELANVIKLLENIPIVITSLENIQQQRMLTQALKLSKEKE